MVRPAEKYGNFMKVVEFCAELIGVNVLVPIYRMNWITYILIISIILFFSMSFNTIRTTEDGDVIQILGNLCTLLGGLSCAIKLWSAIRNPRQYHEIHITMLNLFQVHQKIDQRYESVLQMGCKRLRTVLSVVGLVYLQLVTLAMVLPLFKLMLSGERYMIMFTKLPGFDIKTEFGYWSVFITHEVWITMASLGLYAGDTVIVICLVNSLLYVDILKLKIEDLNDAIDRKRENDAGDDKKITGMLLEIVAWHQSYFAFTDKCNEIFFWNITTQISCSFLSIVITLYIIMASTWPGAYAYVIYGFNSLYEYCILGTKVDKCNDQFCSEIYSIHWYDLNIPQQKIVRLMLMRAQSPRTINIAGVMPMTVSTALGLTRTIYSTFMMLLQFQ